MNFAVRLTCLVFLFLPLAPAQTPSGSPNPAALTGRWLFVADFYGTPRYSRFDLKQQGDKISGTFAGSPIEGTLTGNTLHFIAKDSQGNVSEGNATLQGGTLTGTITGSNPSDKAPPMMYKFTATPAPPRPTGPPQRHEFTPTVFYRQFSPFNKPVLTVAPGDTIHTTTVDAGGNDEKDVKRVAGGNPQTGPFYVQSAMPGDTLVVHINRLRLNRDSAGSDDAMVQSSLNSDLAVRMKDTGKSIAWRLDLPNGVATPQNPSPHLAHYTVPLRPMLGCIATAPGPGGAPPPTGDSGPWGGNMDFNEIVEGATVYLPVSNPGALLYLGDAHALQGDGELNGNALETSMDVEFTVDVLPGKRISAARVESATHIMATAYSGSLDDAFKDATSNMAEWLAQDYKLTPSEIAQVLGTASEYRVSEVADRNSGIVLKLSKERLRTLTPSAP